MDSSEFIASDSETPAVTIPFSFMLSKGGDTSVRSLSLFAASSSRAPASSPDEVICTSGSVVFLFPSTLTPLAIPAAFFFRKV